MPPKKSRLSSRKNRQSTFHQNRAAETRSRREQLAEVFAQARAEADEHEAELLHQAQAEAEQQQPSAQGMEVELTSANEETQTDTALKEERATQSDRSLVDDKATQFGPSLKDKACQSDITVGVDSGTSPGVSHFQETLQSIQFCLSDDWTVLGTDGKIHVLQLDVTMSSPLVRKAIIFNPSTQEIDISVNGLPLLNNHDLLWTRNNQPFRLSQNVELQRKQIFDFVIAVQNLDICSGCTDQNFEYLWEKGIYADRGLVVSDLQSGKKCFRARNCHLLIGKNRTICSSCSKQRSCMIRQFNRSQKEIEKEKDISKVNIRYLSKQSLEAALRQSREGNKKLSRKVKDLENRIKDHIDKRGVFISKPWSETFTNVNKSNFEKMTPLQQLFWDQQMKVASLKRSSSMRWHPMMIRVALNLHASGNGGIEKFNKLGFMTLPGKRTLFDYSHAVDAKEGCQKEVLEDIKNDLDSKCKEDHERYVCLMCDEIHIRSNLVYQRSTGELVGYVKLDNVENEFEKIKQEWTGVSANRELAKSILTFMVRNITPKDRTGSVKGVVAMYSCSSLTPAALYSKAWDVIFHLESAKIPVLVFTCDGAAVNRSFINMHCQKVKSKHTYVTYNLVTPDKRSLFFIIDPPHLLKTLRNNFANSGCHRKSRKLMKNGENISWTLIMDHYERHKKEKLRKCQLSAAHVYLNSFSTMRVSFASKVMSRTLIASLKDDAKEDLAAGKLVKPFKEARKLMRRVNDWFDMNNAHNPTSWLRFRNDRFQPYNSECDPRFDWMEKKFLGFFQEWEKEIMSLRVSKKLKSRMFISHQSYTAMHISVYGFIGAVKFLLKAGAKDICGRKFCQDPLEQYFSVLRARRGSDNNPDLFTALNTRVTLHAQKQVAVPSSKGNTVTEDEDMFIDDTPVPKRRKLE